MLPTGHLWHGLATAFSLIGFGFAIAQAYELYIEEYASHSAKALDISHALLIFGISFMALGLFGLVVGTILHRKGLRQIRSNQYRYEEQIPFTVVVVIILVIILCPFLFKSLLW